MLFFGWKFNIYTEMQRTLDIQSYIEKVECLSRGLTLPDFKTYYE